MVYIFGEREQDIKFQSLEIDLARSDIVQDAAKDQIRQCQLLDEIFAENLGRVFVINNETLRISRSRMGIGVKVIDYSVSNSLLPDLPIEDFCSSELSIISR